MTSITSIFSLFSKSHNNFRATKRALIEAWVEPKEFRKQSLTREYERRWESGVGRRNIEAEVDVEPEAEAEEGAGGRGRICNEKVKRKVNGWPSIQAF